MKKIIYNIFTIVLTLIVIPLLFYFKINDGEILYQTLPYAIMFDLSFWALLIIIYKIGFDICDNTRDVRISKYKIFKFFNHLQQEGNLKDFENFSISLNNKEIVNSVQLYLSKMNYSEVYNIIEAKQLDKIKEIIKNSGINNWKEKYKVIENLVSNFNTPKNLDMFIKYYNNSLIQNNSKIFSVLYGFISFIISLVSLFGINSFQAISLEFYSAYIVPVLVGLYQIISYYRKDKMTTCNHYEEILKKLNEQYALFKNNKIQDS